MTSTTTTTYFVTRDSATAWRDEDRAMAHVSIAGGVSTLQEAQNALVEYMNNEVKWLTGSYVSASSLRRAAEIMDGIGAVRGMTPAQNSRTSIRTANLVWTIARNDRSEVTAI
jgi:hypothetical protein